MNPFSQLSSWCWRPPDTVRTLTQLTQWKKALNLLSLLSFISSFITPAVLLADTCKGNYISYDSVTGQLQIPALDILNSEGQSEGMATAVLQQVADTRDGIWFEVVSATSLDEPVADVSARYDGVTGQVELNGYILGNRGEIRSFNKATFTLDAATGRFLMNGLTDEPFSSSGLNAPIYAGDETVFPLVRGGADQFLLPVEIGNQTLNLLVDTGSDALLVFEDRLSECNQNVRKREDSPIQVSDTPVSKSYASGTRQGVLATAPVRIGAYSHPAMQIMVIQSPDSQSDPSLTAKGADGIIGLRHTAGLNLSEDAALLDAPLNLLSPLVGGVEFNLPPAGEATLAFGKQPVLEQADENVVFRAKARAIADPNDRQLRKRFADMQVPFRVKTRYGEAADDDLDILLDTGAVSRLVLDTKVAEKLGYNATTGEWMIDEDEDIELSLIGLTETTTLYPKFKVWEVSVAPYSTMGVEFEAVLGISRWQDYVVGFDFVPDYNGGPDGTISLLRRLDISDEQTTELSDDFVPLQGLNSVGNDEFPTTDSSGELIAFQSDRKGDLDVYVWQHNHLLSLPNLNSAANETRPALSADGRWLAYESDREGTAGLNIYLYDLVQQQPVELAGLNSDSEDSMPTLSGDGRYLAFVSWRDGDSKVYLYDRDNASFVDLVGVIDGDMSAPALSEEGRYLAFIQHLSTPGGQGISEDIRIYDIQTHTLLPLSNGIRGINTGFNEQHPALSSSNQLLAFHSNRRNPEMGLYNRDIFIIDMVTQVPLAFPGLNSEFDEVNPHFANESVVFQSRRPGGEGGSDIYQYRLQPKNSNQQVFAKQQEAIAFTKTKEGLFAAPVTINEQALNLVVDTTLNALVIFRDVVNNLDATANLTETGQPFSLPLGQGQVNGMLAVGNLTLGEHQANGMRIVIAERQACVDALGISLSEADGILGLASHPFTGLASGVPSGANLPLGPPPGDTTSLPPPLPTVPLQALRPAINIMELNFDATGAAGMTLGKMPLLGHVSRSVTHHSGIPGERNPQNPAQAHTDMRVPFIAMSYDAEGHSVGSFGTALSYQNPEALGQAIAGTLLQDRVILDTQVATALGYDATNQSWPTVDTVDISLVLFGSDTLLPVANQIPVTKIQVADLSQTDHTAIIGVDYWQNYVLGVDLKSDGFGGVIFIVDRNKTQNTTAEVELNSHFMLLPGLNSIGDELNADISDDGKTIVFQSNRADDADIYVWKAEQGIVDLPNLNSAQIDRNPSINGEGNLIAFESLRNGQPDIFVYDLTTHTFLELPDLNTTFPEESPKLSATTLAYTSRREAHNGSADTYLYDLTTKQPQRLYSGWFNTDADELRPSLNRDGSLIAFEGMGRSDGTPSPEAANRGTDVYLYNLQRGQLKTLPHLNSAFAESHSALSANSDFLAFDSNRYDPSLGHVGNDVLLMELASGELLDLPGLNSAYEDANPALTDNAEYVLFHSKRPGGEGGYDLYLYHRDTQDNTRYIVAEAYLQTGYATDTQGQPQANATLHVTDGDGTLIGSTQTDNAGNFSLSIPAGVVLPLAYVSDNGTVIIDEIGDDTYIPDFEAGNLKFTQVWVEDTLQAGMPSKIWFDVQTDTPKYNTFVKLYLVKLATGSIDELDVNGGNFDVAHTLTALSIEKLGQVGVGNTVIQTQGQDIITEINYLTEDNSQAHVEHSFIVPANVEDGTYAVVFSINRFDYHPEDDALQSEDLADKNDNFLAAPATVIVGQPDKPNLRILSAELNSNSFELPEKRPAEGSTPFISELTLNMEVESMAQDTELPVDVVFSLDIDGKSYPLTFADNKDSRPSKVAKKTYPVTCRAETREGYPEGERCASLFRQEQTGYTYKLYIDETAYDTLAAKTADTVVDLVIQLDPEATVAEWENNTADNIKAMPVMFLVTQEDSDARSTGRSTRALTNTPNTYANELFSLASIEDASNSYGNDDFGAGYEFNATLTYATGSYQGTTYPYAASFDGESNRAYISIFGYEIDMLRVDVGADVNGDKLICSWFEYNVDILEMDQYDEYLYVDGIDPSDASCTPSGNGLNTEETTQEYELWNSQDDDGNEKYSVSKSKDYEKSFTIGAVPITVAAGATGELGIKGSVVIDTSNTLSLSAGPYVSLTGYAEGGIGITGLNAGIGVNLLILGIELPFTAALQVLPSYPLAEFTFEAPLIISTLDGDLYIYAKIAWDQYTYTILEWEGLEWEIPLIDPIVLTWAEPNQFILDTTSGTPPTLDAEAYELNYDWGSQNAFTASWFGWYDFTPGTYSFEASTQGNQELVLKVDVNDDDSYEIDSTVTSDAGLNVSTNIGSDTIADIQVSYDHGSGDAGLALSWSQINTFFVSYYNNTTLSGNTALADMEDTIDHDWGASSPDDEKNINADGFSARWTGTYEFDESGSYMFIVESDDSSVSLKIDNAVVGLTMSDTDGDGIYYGEVAVSVTNGSHDIELEYVHTSGDAKITLDWQPADKWLFQVSASLDTRTNVTVRPISEPTVVRYFEEGEVESMSSPTYILPAENFSVYFDSYTNDIGEDLMAEFEDVINSEYNNGSFDPIIEYEDIYYNVISHYKGYFYFDTDATYDFIARVDDGMKLYVDGKQYLGHWNINEASAYIIPITLTAGYHLIEVEHYDEVQADETLAASKQISTESNYRARELAWTQRQNNEFIGFYYSTLENMEADDQWDADTYDGTEPLVIGKTADAVTGCYFTSSSLSCDWGIYGPTRQIRDTTSGETSFVLSETDPTPYTEDSPYLDGIDNTSSIYSNDGYGALSYLSEIGINSNIYNSIYGDYDGYGYLTVDNFGVRWVGDFDFNEGVYVFNIAADDGVRLWIDDVIVIDQWNSVSDTSNTEVEDLGPAYRFTIPSDAKAYQEAVAMSAGTHNIRIEYWEDTDYANIEVHWTEVSQDIFAGYYFNDTDFSANFFGTFGDVEETVSTIDYSGSINARRWVGVYEFEEADYTFTVNTDGGVRVYLDGEAIIDEWVAQSSSTTYTTTVSIVGGLHSLKVEYLKGNSSSPAIDVSWLASTIAENALAFDGTDDYVELSNESAFDFSSDFTVETWFKVDSFTATWQALVTKGDDSWRVHRHSTNNTLNFAINQVSGGNINISTTTSVNDGQWHHVAAVADISQQMMYLYLDGVLESSASFTDNISQSNYPVQIGANAQRSGRNFYGEVDEVRIWNTARSQVEIQAYMNSTLSGTESNLVAYYQFDETSGTTASDTTGSYNGTLNGDPQWVTSGAMEGASTEKGNRLGLQSSYGGYVSNETGTLKADTNQNADADYLLNTRPSAMHFMSSLTSTSSTTTCIQDGDTVILRTNDGQYWSVTDGVEQVQLSNSLTDAEKFTVGFITVATNCLESDSDRFSLQSVLTGNYVRGLSDSVLQNGTAGGGHYSFYALIVGTNVNF